MFSDADILCPDRHGVRSGDPIHTRSPRLFGRTIRRATRDDGGRKPWGNHDGRFVNITPELAEAEGLKTETWGWHVAEAVSPRFRLTPWAEYVRVICDGGCSFAVLRQPDMGAADSEQCAVNALEMVGLRYDWWAILGHGFSLFLKAHCLWNLHWAWYCTESNAKQALDVDPKWDVLGLASMPTPYTTEKRCRAGKFGVVWESSWGDEPVFSEYQANVFGVIIEKMECPP